MNGTDTKNNKWHIHHNALTLYESLGRAKYFLLELFILQHEWSIFLKNN